MKPEKRKLPERWRWKLLGDMFELKYGEGLTARQRRSGDVPVFGSNGIVGYHDQAITKGTTIVIGRKGSAGELNWSDVPCWPIDTTYFIDELKCESSLGFVYFYLRSAGLTFLDKSSAVPGLNRDDVYRLRIPFPPTLDDQIAISTELERRLNRVESMRQDVEQQEEALKAAELALLSHTFTSNSEKGWIRVRMGEIADVVMGQSPDGSTYNKTGQGKPLLNGPTEFGEDHPIPVQWTTSPKKLGEPDDILLCVRGNTTGRMNQADQVYALGRGVAAVRGKEGKGNTGFVRYALSYQLAALLFGSQRSTFPNIGKEDIEGFSVFAPRFVMEQERIATLLDGKLKYLSQVKQAASQQQKAISALPGAILREAFDFGE